MPRAVFRLASDADNKDVDCYAFGRVNGKPYCDALQHPHCLAPGCSPELCNFRVSREEYYSSKREKESK